MVEADPTEAQVAEARLTRWLLDEGRDLPDLPTLLRAYGHRVRPLGVERIFYGSYVLHPQTAAFAFRWRASDDELVVHEFPHAFFEARRSGGETPMDVLKSTKAPLRWPLVGPAAVGGDEARALAAEGYTELFGIPNLLAGQFLGGVTFATTREGGFTPSLVALLSALHAPFRAVADRHFRDLVMRALLRAYLGDDAGDRVFAGQVRRGDMQAIRAALWFSDLRGFTRLSGVLERPALLALLNATFELLVVAIEAEGGQVLKFIGDGLLATFAADDDAVACSRAADAARRAQESLAQLREDRTRNGLEPPHVGIGLHFGDVIYGNIGSPGRLDFTVIGQAVNVASRIEGLCSKLGRSVLLSDEIAARLDPRRVVPVGSHEVKGVADPVAVHALAAVEP